MRHGNFNSAESQEAREDRVVAQLTKERKTGPPDPKKWPTDQCALKSRPFCNEVAIFVSFPLHFSQSAQSLNDIKIAVDEQLARANALAGFLQMITQPLAGKIENVHHGSGVIGGGLLYNMHIDGGREIKPRPKVDVQIIGMPIDCNRPLSVENIAGFIIRACAVDWNFSFSDALAFTIATNRRLAETRGNITAQSGTNDARTMIGKIYGSGADDFVHNNLPHNLLYDIVLRPEIYREPMLEWADAVRRSLIEKKIAQLTASAKSAKRSKEKREKNSPPAGAAAGGGAPDAAPMDVDDDDDDAVELSEKEHARIRTRAIESVTYDNGIPINCVMTQLFMNADNPDMRSAHSKALLDASLNVHIKKIVRDCNVVDPSTPDERLASLGYGIKSFSDWVSIVGVSFGQNLGDAMSIAKTIDLSQQPLPEIRSTALAPECMFSMKNALELAKLARADALLCEHQHYYATRDDYTMYADAQDVYNPSVVHSNVTFPPLGIIPSWGRTDEELQQLCQDRVISHETIAPHYARVVDPANTRDIPTTIANFGELRQYLLWFAEDDTPDLIDKAYAEAIKLDSMQTEIMQSIAADSVHMFNAHVQFDACAQADVGPPPFMFSSRRRAEVMIDLESIERLRGAGCGLGTSESDQHEHATEMATIRHESSRSVSKRQRELAASIGSVPKMDAMQETDITGNVHFVSNFTFIERRLRSMKRKMDALAFIDQGRYLGLIGRFRAYCLKAMGRIYSADSYNNGGAMHAVRTYDRENWNDANARSGSGAYQRIGNYCVQLSSFGNRMANDMVVLHSFMNSSSFLFYTWDTLACRRIIAFHNSSSKLHSLLMTQSGQGKSYVQGKMSSLSIPGTMDAQMNTSAQANVDTLASDDRIIVVDEAPHIVVNSGQHEDPKHAAADNIMRGILSDGTVSSSRSVRGKFTYTFSSDCKVTFFMNANRVNPPPQYELSMLMRFEIRRFADNVVKSTSVFTQHHPQSRAIAVRTETVEKLWKGTQALGAIAAKAINCYALPEPSIGVVSCLLEPVMSKVDAYYPIWSDAMRASNRVGVRSRGYAIFNALSLVFNYPLSPYAPEHNASGYNPGFDVMHLTPCAPYLFATTEMFVTSLLWTLDEAVCTDAHVYMYALATTGGFAAIEMERLFVHGGRDHCASSNSNFKNNTEKTMVGAHVSVSKETCDAAINAKRLLAMSEQEQEQRRRQFVSISSKYNPLTKKVESINEYGAFITREMQLVLAYENNVIAWWNSLGDVQRREFDAIHDGDYRYRVGGWRPEHWNRSKDEMPAFWSIAETQLRALEGRNNSESRKGQTMTFLQSDGIFNPNYIRIRIDSDFTGSVQSAIGSYTISRNNCQYILDFFVKNHKASSMMLPQLQHVECNNAIHLKWLMSGESIVVRRMPVAKLSAKETYIDISTVWLFLGAYHNHVMDMVTTLEDKHIPAEGRTIMTPIPDPSAPYLLQTIKLKRREGHVIRVPNPEYIGSCTANASLSSVPSEDSDTALFSLVDSIRASRNPNEPCTSDVVSGIGWRAANEIIGAVVHGVNREKNAGLSLSDRKRQTIIRRNVALYERDHGPDPQKRQAVENDSTVVSNPYETDEDALSFMAPTKRLLVFDRNSVDDQLHRVYMARTGQSRDCSLKDIETLLKDDAKLTASVVARSQQRIHDQSVTMFLEQPESTFDESGDDDDNNSMLDNFDETKQALEMCSEIGDIDEALQNHIQLRMESVNNYPGPLQPVKLAPWVETDIAAAEHRLTSIDSYTENVSKVDPIPVPPSFTPDIAKCYKIVAASKILPGFEPQTGADVKITSAPVPVPATKPMDTGIFVLDRVAASLHERAEDKDSVVLGEH